MFLQGLNRLSALSRMDPDIGQMSQTASARQPQLRYRSKMQKVDSTRVIFDCGEDSWFVLLLVIASYQMQRKNRNVCAAHFIATLMPMSVSI